MAWERRRNGKEYYYSARRINGKVVKKCHGTGWRGLMAEITVSDIAKARKASKDARDDYIAELWSLERTAKLAKIASRTALYAAYLLAGYEQTRQHKWIKTKESTMNIPTLFSLSEQMANSEVADAETPPAEKEQVKAQEPPKAPQFWPTSIDETIKLIMAGRRDLLEVLRSQLAEVPDLWAEVSDLTRVTIQGWATKIAQDEFAFRESIVLAATTERAELLGKCSSIMERAIVDRWTITKLQLAYFDIVVSNQDETSLHTKRGVAIEQRHRSAEHQFREAGRQLSRIRSLQDEIAPDTPMAAEGSALRLHDPDEKLKRKAS